MPSLAPAMSGAWFTRSLGNRSRGLDGWRPRCQEQLTLAAHFPGRRGPRARGGWHTQALDSPERPTWGYAGRLTSRRARMSPTSVDVPRRGDRLRARPRRASTGRRGAATAGMDARFAIVLDRDRPVCPARERRGHLSGSRRCMRASYRPATSARVERYLCAERRPLWLRAFRLAFMALRQYGDSCCRHPVSPARIVVAWLPRSTLRDGKPGPNGVQVI